MPSKPSPVVCPHCGSASTLPLPGLADKVGSVFGLAFGKARKSLDFSNPDLLRQYQTGAIDAVCTACRRRFNRRTPPPQAEAPRPVVERLKELQTLRAEGLVTDDEYQRKRDEILRAL